MTREEQSTYHLSMDKFKHKLYKEFDDNALTVLGVSGDRVREVLAERGQDVDAEFEEAWSFGGATFMRQSMCMVLVILERVYHETEIGRELNDEEFIQRVESFRIGLDEEVIYAWQDMKIKQTNNAETEI